MVFQTFRFLMKPTFFAAEDGATDNAMMSNKGSLKDFLASIATMSGDLSNITAPPFVLDQKSVVEIPAFWAENPSVFVSPATSEDPIERALLVLKSFLGGMKSQCYMGHTEEEGLKKPLNAFLGELFVGQWDDEKLGTTYLVSEQVSHHPPITACRVWNPKLGVIAEGYNKQKVTFSWTHMAVQISSTGFALKTIEKYNEHYLLPLPDFKVKGVLSGAPYPETEGKWYIPSTNGYMSEITFEANSGFLSTGKKHAFSAVLYKEEDGPKHPIYTIEGCWNTEFTIKDERSGKILETFNVNAAVKNLPKLNVPSLEEMSPWETRRAWHDTKEAIQRNDFKGVTAAKSYLEQGQRDMRKEEEKIGNTWRQLFFKNSKSHDIVAQLMAKTPGQDFAKTIESTKGVWQFDAEAYENAERPYHVGVEPDNLKEGQERIYRNGSRASFQASPASTPRGSMDIRDDSRPRASLDYRHRQKLDEKLGAISAGGESPKRQVNGNVKEQHSPRKSQSINNDERLNSGVEGLSLKDKVAVEDMLRSNYSSG